MNDPWPHFLIVGAQKCGTTTLFRDMSLHPGIFVPAEKEPEILSTLDDPQQIEDAYRELFARAGPGEMRGEASTGYTKRPDNEGVADKALKLFGPQLKILYIEREPVERILSHYLHAHQNGKMPESLDEALVSRRELIDYTRYDWQIAPWLASFGPGNVLRLNLADYSADRQRHAEMAIEFIGLDPAQLGTIDPNARANTAGEYKVFTNPVMKAIFSSSLYQKRIKPLFAPQLREKVRRAVLPKPEVTKVSVSDEQKAYIFQQLAAGPHD